MNENLDWYAEGETIIIYNRADGGSGVRIWRKEIAEVVLWLSAFQQGVRPILLESPREDNNRFTSQSG